MQATVQTVMTDLSVKYKEWLLNQPYSDAHSRLVDQIDYMLDECAKGRDFGEVVNELFPSDGHRNICLRKGGS